MSAESLSQSIRFPRFGGLDDAVEDRRRGDESRRIQERQSASGQPYQSISAVDQTATNGIGGQHVPLGRYKLFSVEEAQRNTRRGRRAPAAADYGPREELPYQQFHPHLDIYQPLPVFDADEYDDARQQYERLDLAASGTKRQRTTRRTAGESATEIVTSWSSPTAGRSRGRARPARFNTAEPATSSPSRRRKRGQGEDDAADGDEKGEAGRSRTKTPRHPTTTRLAATSVPSGGDAFSARTTGPASTLVDRFTSTTPLPSSATSAAPSKLAASAVPTTTTATVGTTAYTAIAAAPAAQTMACTCCPPATSDYAKSSKGSLPPAGHASCSSCSRVKPLAAFGDVPGKKRGKLNAQGMPQHKTCKKCRIRILETKLKP